MKGTIIRTVNVNNKKFKEIGIDEYTRTWANQDREIASLWAESVQRERARYEDDSNAVGRGRPSVDDTLLDYTPERVSSGYTETSGEISHSKEEIDELVRKLEDMYLRGSSEETNGDNLNDIAPYKASLEDGVFFDGKNTKYSISDKNIKDVSTGYASGESYYTMSYTQDSKVVGTLEYGEYDGEPNVKMIEVEPEYRRKGIATKLMQELQRKYPEAEINFGMATPDGSKLLDAITYDVTDETVVADRQKLKTLQTELDDLQGQLDVLFEMIDNGKDLTEAQDIELHELGDKWQDTYETIRELEKSLQGKRATKTFVKTDTQYSLSTDTESRKQEQFTIIQETNPAPNSYNTWIRSVNSVNFCKFPFNFLSISFQLYQKHFTKRTRHGIIICYPACFGVCKTFLKRR